MKNATFFCVLRESFPSEVLTLVDSLCCAPLSPVPISDGSARCVLILRLLNLLPQTSKRPHRNPCPANASSHTPAHPVQARSAASIRTLNALERMHIFRNGGDFLQSPLSGAGANYLARLMGSFDSCAGNAHDRGDCPYFCYCPCIGHCLEKVHLGSVSMLPERT